MNQTHEHVSFWDWVKGIALAIGYYIMSILEGWVKHNGGGLEMLYSIMTIIVYGLIGTGVSFLGAKFWKWLSKLSLFK